jgi:hypothetical protein
MDHRTETPHGRRLPETKTFLLSSEFWVFGIAVAAMLFAAYALDDLRDATAWRYCAFIAIGYIVSRGIAKAGTRREYTSDARPPTGYSSAPEAEWSQRRADAVGRDVTEPRTETRTMGGVS